MTSEFARNHGLSQETQEAYVQHSCPPRNIDDTLYFYHTYLKNVVPRGVTVHHIPADRSHVPQYRVNTREEIQLLTPSGRIFMSGLVSTETRTEALETTAGNEAYTKWLDGYFVPDDQKWRFFTGRALITFFKSSRDDEWETMGDFGPDLYAEAEEVAAYLQQEYDRLEFT